MAATTLETIQPYVEQLFDDSDVQKHAGARDGEPARREVARRQAPSRRRRRCRTRRCGGGWSTAPRPWSRPASPSSRAPEKQARRSRRGWLVALAAVGAGAYVATNEEARTKLLGLIGQTGARDGAGGRMTDARETQMAGSRAVGNSADDASASELVKQLSEQTSRLVQQEMELAKAELSEKGKQAGIGAGLFGGAGVFGLYALGALTAAIIAALEPRDGHLAGRADRDRPVGGGRRRDGARRQEPHAEGRARRSPSRASRA